MATRSLDIAIVGAGTGGLSTAAFLARDGHRVTLFERFEKPEAVGSGLLIQPTGQAVLSALGKLNDVLADGRKLVGIDGRTSPRLPVLSISYAPLGDDFFGLGLRRSSLFNAVYSAASEAGVEFELSHEIIGFGNVDGAQPEIMDKSGRSLGAFDVAIDASGTFSRIRTAHLGDHGMNVFDYGAVWATLPMKDTGLNTTHLHQRFRGTRLMAGTLPIGCDEESEPVAAFFWSLRRSEFEAWRQTPIDEWKAEVLAAWPELDPMLMPVRSHEDLTHAVYADINVEPVLGPATVIIGDSAHGTSPQLGNGANLALVDAAVLAKCLRSSSSVSEALFSYAQARRTHVLTYQVMSAYLTPFFQSNYAPLGWVRDLTFGGLCSLPLMRKQFALILSGLKVGPFGRLDLSTLI